MWLLWETKARLNKKELFVLYRYKININIFTKNRKLDIQALSYDCFNIILTVCNQVSHTFLHLSFIAFHTRRCIKQYIHFSSSILYSFRTYYI